MLEGGSRGFSESTEDGGLNDDSGTGTTSVTAIPSTRLDDLFSDNVDEDSDTVNERGDWSTFKSLRTSYDKNSLHTRQNNRKPLRWRCINMEDEEEAILGRSSQPTIEVSSCWSDDDCNLDFDTSDDNNDNDDDVSSDNELSYISRQPKCCVGVIQDGHSGNKEAMERREGEASLDESSNQLRPDSRHQEMEGAGGGNSNHSERRPSGDRAPLKSPDTGGFRGLNHIPDNAYMESLFLRNMSPVGGAGVGPYHRFPGMNISSNNDNTTSKAIPDTIVGNPFSVSPTASSLSSSITPTSSMKTGPRFSFPGPGGVMNRTPFPVRPSLGGEGIGMGASDLGSRFPGPPERFSYMDEKLESKQKAAEALLRPNQNPSASTWSFPNLMGSGMAPLPKHQNEKIDKQAALSENTSDKRPPSQSSVTSNHSPRDSLRSSANATPVSSSASSTGVGGQKSSQKMISLHPGSPQYQQIFIYQHQLLIMQFQQYQFQLQVQFQQLSQQQMSPQQLMLLQQQFHQQMMLLQQQFNQQQV